jgi:kexin
MRLPYTLVVTLLAQSAFAWTPAKRTYDTHDYYVVEHDPHGASLADVALALGVEVVEQAGALQNHWLVRITKALLVARGENTDPVHRNFEDLRSRASSHLSSRSEDALQARSIVSSVKYLSARQVLRQRAKRAPPPIRPPPPTEPSIHDVTQQFGITDPLFPQQWHLVNEKYPQHMMNVTRLWELGFTGKGVISSVIDDGLDYTSEDLAGNFVCIAY